LANGLGNLVSRVLNMFEKYWPEGAAPVEAGKLGSAVSDHLESLAFDKALEVIWREIRVADELIEAAKPWQLEKEGKHEEVQRVLTQLFGILQEVASAIAPFMPETHQKLTELLQARPLKKPSEPLFARK